MKKILFLSILLSVVLSGMAQTYPSPPIAKPNNSYGTEMNRLVPDSTLYLPTACGVPTDTTWLFSQGTSLLYPGYGQKMRKSAVYYDSCGHHEYIWDPSLQAWHIADSSTGGAGASPFTTTVGGIVNPPGAFSSRVAIGADNTWRTFVIPSDTSGKWVSKIYRSNDSVYYCKGNGSGGLTCVLAYLDSVGSGGGGITYPNTANKYLNGFGNFPSLNTDSVSEGGTNKYFHSADTAGVAYRANPLSQFAATTSAQLASIISDETGSGAAVFAASPTFTGNPIVPTQTAKDSSGNIASTKYTDQAVAALAAIRDTTKIDTIGQPGYTTTYASGGNIHTRAQRDSLDSKDTINVDGSITHYVQAHDSIPGPHAMQTKAQTDTMRADIYAAIASGGGSGVTYANPTGTIGLTANNGALTSVSRSDATPALSQSIIPTWTGLHTFNAGIALGGNITFTGTTGTITIGDLTHIPLKVFARGLLSDGDLVNGSASGARVRFQINGRDKSSILSTGQRMDSAYIGNAFPGSVTADSVLTINNGFVRMVPAASFSGGGGTDSAIWKNNAAYQASRTLTMNGFIQSFNGGTIQADTFRIGSFVYETAAGDSIVWLGTSISFGTGPTDAAHRFTTVATAQLHKYGFGFTEYNLGISGSTLASQIGNIPVKRPGLRFLNIEFGSNELNAAMDSATYRANYIAFLDTAIARGWSASQICITSQMGSQLGVWALASIRGYNYVDSTLAIQFGTFYTDCFNPELLPQYAYIYATGGLHPTNEQSALLASIVAGSVSRAIQFNNAGQRVIEFGKEQIGHLIYKNNYLVPTPLMLGIDSVGNVGVAAQLPANYSTQGPFWIHGGLIVQGGISRTAAGIPSVFDSTKDIYMTTGAKILQNSGASTYSTFQPFNASGQSAWVNTFGSGLMTLQATNLQFTGISTFSGSAFNLGTTPISAVQGAFTNFITPNEISTGNMYFKNRYLAGNTIWSMSNGTNNAEIQSMEMFTDGSLVKQTTGPISEVPSSEFAVNSTTKGSMPWPRMTVAQRNAVTVGQVSSGSITAGGTSYTNGTYSAVAMTTVSGSGSGGTFNVQVTGNAVSAITITAGSGSGYKIGDTVSCLSSGVGGTGSGFKAIITGSTTDGLSVYNTVTHKPNWWDASFGWRAALDSASAGGSAVNIYNTDGTLTGNRTVTLGGHSVAINGLVGPPAGFTVLVKGADSNTYQVPLSTITAVTTAGTYTPTLTNTTNIASSSLQVAYYTINNGIVEVTIGGTLTATASVTPSTLTVSLPVSGTTTSGLNIGVGVVSGGATGEFDPGNIQMGSAAVTLKFTTTSTGTENFSMKFTYHQ